jgi:DNA mismatch repair protein MSH6
MFQTETPDQLKARNAKRAPGTKMINVVQREAVAVLSRGTLIDPEMVAAHPDAAYVLAGGVLSLGCRVWWGLFGRVHVT